MSEQQESQPFGRNTCHICGGTDFEWGSVNEIQPNGVYFMQPLEQAKRINWLMKPKIEPKRIYARRCVTCSNVQLFAVDQKKTK